MYASGRKGGLGGDLCKTVLTAGKLKRRGGAVGPLKGGPRTCVATKVGGLKEPSSQSIEAQSKGGEWKGELGGVKATQGTGIIHLHRGTNTQASGVSWRVPEEKWYANGPSR